ncbi:MAG: 3-phosphoshikimate 1-carboxyvinyltransferase [Desulfobulbus propionicus]|nr:MAG: 3-phosphoshikimate 1-carboxyvinyltransferase [Desulfobulbus propionicus]
MITIQPVDAVDNTITVPGSKSLTQRALIAAALAEGVSVLHGPLASADTAYTIQALQQMGITVDDSNPQAWHVNGLGGRIATPEDPIYLGNNGTATRFLTALVALGYGIIHITGNERMAKRPILPLMEALKGWGADIVSDADNGCPPLTIQAKGLAGNTTTLPAGQSSQYLSALLLVAPYTRSPAELFVQGAILSQPYVHMTLAVMADFGIRVEAARSLNHFRIPQGHYQARQYHVEGDASGASYFWGAAAVTGGRVTVANVPIPSLQGDTNLVPLLARMGCEVTQTGAGVTVHGPDQLEGIEVDMGDMPDVVPTLAVVAAFAQGTTTINNIAHLRIKECDRLSGVVTELRKMGARVNEEEDRMVIHGQACGSNLHGATISTYEDHRMAMCFAIAGLKIPGVTITDAACVAKSFPNFWEVFTTLGS